MSLLNLFNDGTHSVLVAIFRLLLAEKSMERERLLSLCAPADLADAKHTRATLNTWVELGLFARSAEDKISIHPQIASKERREESLPRLARRQALAEENNERFWEAEKSHSADFTRAISWLLAQDVYEAEYSTWETVQPVIQSQAPESEVFGKNNTRWNGLKAWAPFLGFCWNGKHPTNAKTNILMIDPTDSLYDALPRLFQGDSTLSADEFLSGLSDKLPVLDGGRYRLKVEERLREREGAAAWVPPPTGQLSTSLSRALLRLLSDGVLKGKKQADAPARARLTGRNRAVVAEYSHFSFNLTRPAG
jgi:hypothetical protein